MSHQPDNLCAGARRKLFIAAWRLALLAWITLTLWPVAYGTTRLLQIVLLLFLWSGAIWLCWNKKAIRWCFLVVTVAVVTVLLWPGREPSPSRLRQRYVSELVEYERVRYVWGGENGLGIDCSGLVRRALYLTLWKEGLSSLNPALLRRAIVLWWDDASASALASEYHQQTKRIGTATALTAQDPSQLLAGDLAITANGMHVLANLGNGMWIEADPEVRRVILLPTPNRADDPNIWLKVPVVIARWRELENNK